MALATLHFAHLLLFWPKFGASTAQVCDKPLMGLLPQETLHEPGRREQTGAKLAIEIY